MKKAFKLPEWTTPAIAFNNTTSLPLLLVQSLSVTGILDAIDSSPNVVDKAKAFFLVNAMVGNSLTFALGPKLLNGQEEDAPDAKREEEDEERRIEEQGEEAVESNERTSLLPGSIVRPLTRAGWKGYGEGRKIWIQLPEWAQRVLDFLAQFCNAPLIGAAIGIIIGIVPELHRVFFVGLPCPHRLLTAPDTLILTILLQNSQQSGGHLNPTITQTLSNLGSLFAVLQIIVVGVKLSVAAQKMKSPKTSSDDSSNTSSLPLTPTLIILLARFVLWPAISIPLIYLLATRTSWVLDDPLLWFCLMLMPTGPPALKLTALADVNGAGEEEKLGIAKLLIVSTLFIGAAKT